jgi:hypothetical protein
MRPSSAFSLDVGETVLACCESCGWRGMEASVEEARAAAEAHCCAAHPEQARRLRANAAQRADYSAK